MPITARKIALIAIALWIVIIAAGTVLFFRGFTTSSADGRVAVRLNPAEREFVLTQMRGMLVNVQGIVNGLAGNDPGKVAEAARGSGRSAMNTSPTLMAKLPMAFRQLAKSLHDRFDTMAGEAEGGASGEMLLQRMSAQLATCVACHATFSIQRTKDE